MAAGFSSGEVVGGRWLLGEPLGQGAFGLVFRADDTSTLGLGAAAVKVLHPSTSPREREAFHEEIRKVVALRHPNLVAYLDSGEHRDDDGHPHLFLVTELCRYSLQTYLAREPGRLTADQAERLLADMATGLGYLHSRGLLHRDLKPANVLLGGDDWKLGDFGLTRAMSATGHYHHGTVVMGTPRYMAPELFDDGAASAASDVYAVGVSLHQALTGRTVHEGSDVALLMQVTTKPPAIDRDLPPHWRRLIEQCLDREPANRPGASQLPAVLAESRLKPSSRLAQLSGTSPLATHLGRPLPPPPAAAASLHPSGQPAHPPAVPPAAVSPAAVSPAAASPAGEPAAGRSVPGVSPAAASAAPASAPAGTTAAGATGAGAPTRDDARLAFGVPSGAWSGHDVAAASPGRAPATPDSGPDPNRPAAGPGGPVPGSAPATAAVAPGPAPTAVAPSPAPAGLAPAGLAPAGGQHPGPVRPDGPGPKSAARSRSRSVLVATLALVAVVTIGGIVALLATRGPGQPTDDTTVEEVAGSDTAVDALAAGQTATTVDPAAAAAAKVRLAGLVAGPSDAPTGYQAADATDTSDREFCTGVGQLRVTHPGLAQQAYLFTNASQLFVVRAYAYASAAEAEAAFTAAEGIAPACDGRSLGDDTPEESWKVTAADDVTVDGSVQTTASILQIVNSSTPVDAVIGIYARIDDVLVYAAGSDRGAAVWYAELMVARATGRVPPPKVEPVGTVGTVAPVPASTVRLAVADPASGVGPNLTDWMSGHANNDLDAVATGACEALTALTGADGVAAALQEAYDDLPIRVRTPMTAADHTQLVTLAAPTYCPASAARLGLGPS